MLMDVPPCVAQAASAYTVPERALLAIYLVETGTTVRSDAAHRHYMTFAPWSPPSRPAQPTSPPSKATVPFCSALRRVAFQLRYAINAVGGHFWKGVAAYADPPSSVAATPPDYDAGTVKPYMEREARSIARRVAAPSLYDPLFVQAGALYGVSPYELKMRAVVESGLHPDAHSGQADGLMQFTPGTAALLGVNPADPAQSVQGAARLLSAYQQVSRGNPAIVDMLYYGGGDPAKWGANTRQYAANLWAVRSWMGTASHRSDSRAGIAFAMRVYTTAQEL